jgi:hypothetical protein
MAALCRSTAGRCALCALLPHLATILREPKSATPEQISAVMACIGTLRQLHDAGLPTVDKSQEMTLKMRPGMEAAPQLETRVAVLLRMNP